MSTYDHYITPVPPGTWDVPAAGATRFSWEYDNGRSRLLDLYQRGKDKQWDAAKRIDWSIPVDPTNVMEQSEEFCPIYGSRQWDMLSQKERDELGHHLSAWLFSQFLHGEQGALTVAARIVESVPDMDSKFYAATQAMDEARHVELYARFMREKIGLYYPVNPDLAKLLADALSDSRWDMPYLGMQVLIEGLALAAFGVHRDMSNNALVTQLLAYVMQDEARHVAFGRLALRDYYKELTEAERADREEFIVEGCYLMRNRFRAQEVWERMGFDVRGVHGVHRALPGPAGVPDAAVLPDRAVREGHRAVGAEGAARLHRPGRDRRGRQRPRRADARRRGDRRAGRRGEVRRRAGRPPGRGRRGGNRGRGTA